ncbi:hypothetical protein F511_29221 [Dorcoceras hygrometricum]|uniref:Uncharacterized protein n=1 Tax=Dorcoceras hygrometricum TaxID=472368 RepID=A0A2Z7CUK9_9LAMI|nr:hypothetical protein F511_29221 [Dorcoceras hygrometricum]
MSASGESSTTMHRLLHASGSHPIPPPYDPKIKATTKSREPKDRNNSSTARSDQRKDRQCPRGILSTWELPTHLQYTVPDAHKQLHLLLPTHEMWELPTPLIVANKPSREMRYTGITRSSSSSEVYGNYPLVLKHSILIATMTSRAHRSTTCSTATHKSSWTEAQKTAAGSYKLHQRYPTSLTQQKALNNLKGRIYTYPKKLGVKSDAYANRLHKGDVFAHLTSFKQTSESNFQTKASARGVQCYHSYFNRSCLPPAIEENKHIAHCEGAIDIWTTAHPSFMKGKLTSGQLLTLPL